MKIRLNNQPGSSLILVLLVIAGIVTVTFGIQRITLVQFSQSNREEDNVMAYYAAKAGIEDGLTRFRFDRDVQTQDGKVFRYGLSDAKTSPAEVTDGTAINSITSYRPGNQYYDLKIDFKTNRINVDASTGAPTFSDSQKIAKDDTLQLTGFAASNTPYYLRVAFQATNCSAADQAKAFVQLHYQTEAGATQEATLNLTSGSYDSRTTNQNILINPGANLVSLTRFRSYYCDVDYAFSTSLTSNGYGKGNNAGPKFDDLTTTLTATGYFGSAKRTLVGTINRESGVLIGIYDYTAYAGQGSIKP